MEINNQLNNENGNFSDKKTMYKRLTVNTSKNFLRKNSTQQKNNNALSDYFKGKYESPKKSSKNNENTNQEKLAYMLPLINSTKNENKSQFKIPLLGSPDETKIFQCKYCCVNEKTITEEYERLKRIICQKEDEIVKLMVRFFKLH